MGTQATNSFTSYELTDKEQLEGTILSSLQKQVMQTQRSQIAEEKLGLEFDTSNPAAFTQQEAYKRGQLDILTYLLDASDAAELALVHGNKLNSTESLED